MRSQGNPARVSSKASERTRDQRRAPAPLRRRGEVCIVQGYDVRVAVAHGQLAVSDGAGRNRRERRYGRSSHGLARVVVIGSAGSVSLAALRWLADLGIGFIHLDRDGRLLTHSALVGLDEPKLRRAQALAAGTATGLDISRYLLTEKLKGQSRLLPRLGGEPGLIGAFEAAAARLETAAHSEELVYAERDGAIAYWAAWRSVSLRFRASDAARMPEQWLRFGQRVSPLTGGPRLAVNPANALLNYLYTLLEAEARIGCLTAGLDPGIGIIHADYRGRDSLALDLIEAVRPKVDRYVLELIQQRVFRADDFHETRKGGCRILAPLSHELIDTIPQLSGLIGPIVEQVARTLTGPAPAVGRQLPTSLTGRNHFESRKPARRRRPPADSTLLPPTAVNCQRCGGPLPRRGRVYCDACLPHYQREQFARAFSGSGIAAIERQKRSGRDPTHTPEAEKKRGQTTAERKAAIADWEARYGKLTDLSAFEREILPLIQGVPLSRLMQATGLSLRYVSQVRRGEKTPHPRHWRNLRVLAIDDQSI